MTGPFQGMEPQLGRDVFIAPTASVIGEVNLGDCSSVWHGAAVRGDCWKIMIGSYSNIQDGCVCHVTTGGPDLTVGDYVTVGHNAVIHSCTIEDCCLIGMGAIVLDGAEIGRGSIIAAGAVILEGTVIPPGSLVAGIPGKIKREMGDKAIEEIRGRAIEYHELAMSYLGKGDFSRQVK